jgi:inner membrane protein
MPTTVTHALAGLGVGAALAPAGAPPAYDALAAALGVLPDVDALAFPLGIPYGARFGHRGFSHSFCFALLSAAAFALLTARAFGVPWWQLAVSYSAVIVSHTLLDALTNGGLGVALFSPWDDRRYFFPWRPIQVSPIGLAVFSRWGLRALASEVRWVWVPLALLTAAAWAVRRVA